MDLTSYIFLWPYKWKVFWGVDFRFEEPEEFSKEEAFVRRNPMCPLEM